MGGKSALDSFLKGEKTSVSEIVDDEIDLRVGRGQGPHFNEIRDLVEISNVGHVGAHLAALDWAFSESDTLYLSHDVHPYPAKFIPQLPGQLIARLSTRGELVFDPFGGSGTTALEAIRMGRRSLSIDANPLSELIGRVKTTRLDSNGDRELSAIVATLRDRLADIPVSPDVWLNDFENAIPPIPNIAKWFEPWPLAELALIRTAIANVSDEKSARVASLALSRAVIKVSNQESETRYVSVLQGMEPGSTIRRYLHDLDLITKKIHGSTDEVQYGIAEFRTCDIRKLDAADCPDSSVDLIVTSPPYGNATDYHLYHRFRLFWLGFDPRSLGEVEIGSHLRHQRESTGFDQYLADLTSCFNVFHRVLKSGRYAALVIGNSVYNGDVFDTVANAESIATSIGFERVCRITRPLPEGRRSFKTGRRAVEESILVLRKAPRKVHVDLGPPPYRMHPYEASLRRREVKALLGSAGRTTSNGHIRFTIDPYKLDKTRRLAFTRSVTVARNGELTWQSVLENGKSSDPSSRKDPKYVTHGLHAYKGKFYPQLAKSLMNLADLEPGSLVFDPFCGSGTTLLEAKLNGHVARGSDMNPLAAKIAKAKVGILDVEPSVLRAISSGLLSRIDSKPLINTLNVDQFDEAAIVDIENWFPTPIIGKFNWLFANIRSLSFGVVRDFLEVVASDLVRGVSYQDRADLRIRRRKDHFEDADLLGQFRERLCVHMSRLEKFWSIRGNAPYPFLEAHVIEGDSRAASTYDRLAVAPRSVHLVLTSPPYATALPYIDTDRLSLLLLFGSTSRDLRPLERDLTGSREMSRVEREELESRIEQIDSEPLPKLVRRFIGDLYRDNRNSDAGFRRQNMAALLLRFFTDMRDVFENLGRIAQDHAEIMMVLGDNSTTVAGEIRRIPTVKFASMIAEEVGFEKIEHIPITVTKENLVHVKNSITDNTVIRLRQSG